MSRNSGDGFTIFIGLVIVIFIMGGLGVSCVGKTQENTYTNCKVTDKDRTKNSDGNSDMRIYTDNCGVLEVSDNIFKGQWDSSDIYAGIEVGKTYNFTATGWRVPVLSMFPGIVEVNEVK